MSPAKGFRLSPPGSATAGLVPYTGAISDVDLGVNDITARYFIPTTGYKSVDGTVGASATTGGLTFKNGLYTAGSASSVSFGTTTQIPYMNAGGTDFLYGAGLTFNGNKLTLGSVDAFRALDLTRSFTGSALNVEKVINLFTDLRWTGASNILGVNFYNYLNDYRSITSGTTDTIAASYYSVTRQGSWTCGVLTTSTMVGMNNVMGDSGTYTKTTGNTTVNQSAMKPSVSNLYAVDMAGRVMTYNSFGINFSIAGTPTLTNGTLNANSYGYSITGAGHTVGTHTIYDFYTSVTGGGTHWGYFNIGTGNNLLGNDNVVSYVGTGVDSGYYYNGTNTIWKNYVGTGYFDLQMNLQLSAKNIITDTTTGMQIGTGATQKLSFYGKTPIVQATALTVVDASAVNSGDATTDTVINNMRTRINELES